MIRYMKSKKAKKKKNTAWHLSKKHSELSVLTLGREVDWLFLLAIFIVIFLSFGIHAYGMYTLVKDTSDLGDIVEDERFGVDDKKVGEIIEQYDIRSRVFSERSGLIDVEISPEDVATSTEVEVEN